MKRLTNTKLFCMLEKLDGTFNPDEEEIKQNYDDFVHRVTLVCNSMKGEVPAYFTLHYTRLELERFQILLNNKGVGKKCPHPRLYSLCLSFLSVALQWVEGKSESDVRVCETGSKPEPHPKSKPSIVNYLWEGTITDLIELAIAFYNIKLIRKTSGELITYAEIIYVLKLIFGIKYPKTFIVVKAVHWSVRKMLFLY